MLLTNFIAVWFWFLWLRLIFNSNQNLCVPSIRSSILFYLFILFFLLVFIDLKFDSKLSVQFRFHLIWFIVTQTNTNDGSILTKFTHIFYSLIFFIFKFLLLFLYNANEFVFNDFCLICLFVYLLFVDVKHQRFTHFFFFYFDAIKSTWTETELKKKKHNLK